MYFVGMRRIDELDRHLIGLLRADGRMSVSNLAKELRVSRGTAQNRLDRLVADGVIVGFTVRLRQDIDSDVVRAVMAIQITGTSTSVVARRLREVPEIRNIYTTNGAWDLMVEISVDTLPDLDRVLGAIRAIDGIHSSETSILLTSL